MIGGVASAERNKTEQVVTGYRDELQCQTVETYREVERDQYEYSILTFRLDGAEYSVTFIKYENTMPKYNVENLKNIHRYHNELQQQIDVL